MSLRPRSLVVALLVGLLGASASAGDRTHDRLERALAVRRARGAAAAPRDPQAAGALAGPLAELERRDRAQRAEFDAASARDLPPKAAERLARTRAAWEEGQGRLLRLLRRVAAQDILPAAAIEAAGPSARGRRPPRPEPQTQAPTDGDLDEALLLLRRFRAASRVEPLSPGTSRCAPPSFWPPP